MKLTKTKLRQMINEQLQEGWRSDLMQGDTPPQAPSPEIGSASAMQEMIKQITKEVLAEGPPLGVSAMPVPEYDPAVLQPGEAPETSSSHNDLVEWFKNTIDVQRVNLKKVYADLTDEQIDRALKDVLSKTEALPLDPSRLREAHEYRTGVPEEDVLAHALDLEKYPTTPQEEVSDIIAAALEKAYEHLGGKQVEMIDDELLDKAMELRDWIETLV